MKIILFLILIFNFSYSYFLYAQPTHDTSLNYLYNLSYAVIFLVATYACFRLSLKCKIHRPIHLALGLGSLFFTLGQVSWFVYNIYLHKEIPFPGIPDIFFIGFYVSTAIGGILVMKQEISIKFSWGLILEIVLLTGLLSLMINSFISSASAVPDTTFSAQLLNYIYPFFDSLLVVLTLVAIRSEKGKLQPLLLYFMLSFISLAVADTLFAYQTELGQYWNGNYVDAMFAVGSYLFAMGIIYLPNLLHANDAVFTKKAQNL